MKSFSDFFPFVLMLSFGAIVSCGAHNPNRRPAILEDKRTLGEAKFDPLGYPGDKDVITGDVPIATDSLGGAGDVIASQIVPDTKKVAQAFSVQVFASKSSAEARDFKISIVPLFAEEIRIDYQAPYYRVDIGMAVGFDDAEALLKKVKDLGFPEAWLVRARD